MNYLKSVGELFLDSYKIPCYQRSFTWEKKQIEDLLRDIYEAKEEGTEDYYLGALVVIKSEDDLYFEVVDGQQRLTVLYLISSLLGMPTFDLTYESRDHIEEFFTKLREIGSAQVISEEEKLNNQGLSRFVQALKTIIEIDLSRDGKKVQLINNEEMKSYIRDHVKIVRSVLPQKTDVASYFEIMGNRGEQLQMHEIVKAKFLKKVNKKEQKRFAQIWDACSQMGGYIEELLPDYFNDLIKVDSQELSDSDTTPENPSLQSIDQILSNYNYVDYQNNKDSKEVTSILDWPNFLIYVMKVFNPNVPLDSKHLIKAYNDICNDKPDPWIFLDCLLKIRIFFDHFIIKVDRTGDSDYYTNESIWSLSRVTKKNSESHLQKEPTFDGKLQERIIKAQSMLQVSDSGYIYKTWLYDLFKWFQDNNFDISVIQNSPQDLIKFIDEDIILKKFEDLKFDFNDSNLLNKLSKENSVSLGTQTPHFLLNFIDYLYWVEKENGHTNEVANTKNVKNFNFRFWNSIEHHLPQSEENSEQFVDNLGNLFLISRSANSSLWKLPPTEKVRITSKETNKGPNRQIIYAITASEGWGEKQIFEHYKNLIDLLSKREKILSLKV